MTEPEPTVEQLDEILERFAAQHGGEVDPDRFREFTELILRDDPEALAEDSRPLDPAREVPDLKDPGPPGGVARASPYARYCAGDVAGERGDRLEFFESS